MLHGAAMKSALLVLLVTRIAHAGSGFEERPLEQFPDAIRQIVALDGGGAYALGVDKQMQNHAVWIAPDGTLRRDPIPSELGAAYHVTPDLAWMLGTGGIAHRYVDGWKVIESKLTGLPTWGRIMALTPTTALVSRPKDGGFISYEIDTAGNTSEVFGLPDLELASLIPDGFGGAWALVLARRDGYVGYAKYERGSWTLWRSKVERKPLLDGFRLAERIAHEDLVQLVSDGNGGCLAVSRRSLFHITASGAILWRRALTVVPNGFNFDPGLDQILMFSWPYAERVPPQLHRLDRDGHPLANDVIPVPAILPHRSSAEWTSMATRDGRTWIAVNSLVYRFERGTFTAFYSGPERRKDRSDHEWRVRLHEELTVRNARRSRASILSASLGSTLALGGGALAVSAREETFPRAALAVTAGAVGALAPTIVLDEVLQHTTHSDNPMSNLAAGFGTVVGFTGTTLLGALGSWGTIETFSDSGARGRTFGGAVLGAAAGTLISTQVLKALRKTFPNHYGMRLGIAASLIGTAATIGARAARP